MTEEAKEEKNRKWYEANRQNYLANQKEQQELLDKNMLLFASAVFGFSVTISERLGGSLLLNMVIGIAWLFFTFSIIAVFFSFRASANASEDFVKQFDENYLDKKYYKPLHSKHNDRVPCWNEVAFWTNIIGLILFFIAIYLSLFTEIQRRNDMSDEPKKNAPITERVHIQQPSTSPSDADVIKGVHIQQPSNPPEQTSDNNSGESKK